MIVRPLSGIALATLLLLHDGVLAFSELDERETALDTQRATLIKDRNAFNNACGQVLAIDTAKVGTCQQWRDKVLQQIEKYKADRKALDIIKQAVEGQRDFFDTIRQDELRITLGIKRLAQKLGWSAAKQARLGKALKDLGFDGLDDITGENVSKGWRALYRQSDNADLVRAAGERTLPTVAQKAGNDCTIAAMATAAGLAYDDVARQAKNLIHQGEWRHPSFRDDPQDAIRQGLTGGEVVMLAESLGQAEVVPSAQFEKTLKGGRPVMVNVVILEQKARPGAGMTEEFGNHQIVLTNTFKSGGKTWFEVADSRDPTSRYFATPDDLQRIIQEKGIAFSRDRPSR